MESYKVDSRYRDDKWTKIIEDLNSLSITQAEYERYAQLLMKSDSGSDMEELAIIMITELKKLQDAI